MKDNPTQVVVLTLADQVDELKKAMEDLRRELEMLKEALTALPPEKSHYEQSMKEMVNTLVDAHSEAMGKPKREPHGWVVPGIIPGEPPPSIMVKQMPELRDQFAMAALTGICTNPYSCDGMAVSAYAVADAMLKAREPQGDANE